MDQSELNRKADQYIEPHEKHAVIFELLDIRTHVRENESYPDRVTPAFWDAQFKKYKDELDAPWEDIGPNAPPPIAPGRGEDKDEKKSQATLLVEIAEQFALLFSSSGEEAYSEIKIKSHVEFWPVRSKGFRDWLSRQFWVQHRKAPSSQAFSDALNVIEANARYSGDERKIYIRTAEINGNIYLDLCNAAWECVEVSSGGWRVLNNPPVTFIRHRHMQELPMPTSEGNISDLWRFLNVPEKDHTLIKAWLLMALRHDLPYPVLSLQGSQGSAKSTASRVLRRLVDPSCKDSQSPPRSEDDIFVSLSRSHITAIDNLSGVQGWLSDTLCRAATGASIGKRKLFTDGEEAIIQVKRPIIINGINGLACRQDLISRQILINLEDISDSERKKESEFWADFEKAHPSLLGALLNIAVGGLQRLPETHINPPRMADFAQWATACLGDSFLEAYRDNRRSAVEEGLDDYPITGELVKLVEHIDEWRSTAGELFEALSRNASQRTKAENHWPSGARGLGKQMNRLSTALREIGLKVTKKRESDGFHYSISKIDNNSKKTAQTAQTTQDKISPCSESKKGNVVCGGNAKDKTTPKYINYMKSKPNGAAPNVSCSKCKNVSRNNRYCEAGQNHVYPSHGDKPCSRFEAASVTAGDARF